MFPVVLDTIRIPRTGAGRPRTKPDRVVADKAYSSRKIRHLLRRRNIKATIPERRDQITTDDLRVESQDVLKGPQFRPHANPRHHAWNLSNRARRAGRGGRPPAFDKTAYRGRNVVERCFARLKQFRAVATRFDKLADRYRAGIVIAALILWLRADG
jgi:transposase